MGETHAYTAHNDIRIIIRMRFIMVLYIVQCREGSACARYTMICIYIYSVCRFLTIVNTYMYLCTIHTVGIYRLCALM